MGEQAERTEAASAPMPATVPWHPDVVHPDIAGHFPGWFIRDIRCVCELARNAGGLVPTVPELARELGLCEAATAGLLELMGDFGLVRRRINARGGSA